MNLKLIRQKKYKKYINGRILLITTSLITTSLISHITLS